MLYAFVILSGSYLNAQDLHHTQFYTSPLNTNPALTGIFNGDYRVALNYRSQWFVDDVVNYQRMSVNADMKFTPRSMNAKGFWSAGMLFNYDRAGDSKLSLAHLGLSGSYTRALNTENLVSLGILAGFGQRRFQTDDLLWASQWDGTRANPNLPTNEDLSNTSNAFLDLGAGINYRWQKSTRTFVNLGLGVFHINQPDQVFFSQSSTERLRRRWSTGLITSFKIIEQLDVMVHGLFQRQGKYQEILYGAYARIHINQQRGKEFALLLGGSARPDDSWTPKIAFEFRSWYAGFSYDVNNSGFREATNRRGGPEFSLIYRVTRVKPLPQFKNCPIF